MTKNKNTLTVRENEVLALSWQCFEADPKYTASSARFAMGKIKTKIKAMTAGVSEDNPAPLKGKGPPHKKRAAKDKGDDEEAEGPKPKKRTKKTTAVPDMNGDEVDAMMGLGGDRKGEVKVKREPEDLGFGMGGGEDIEEA